jgi:RpiB/LacA/LacB family sugar-phosphate isomerase
MIIVIANDHRGWKLKLEIMEFLEKAGHKVKNFGCDSADSVNFPEFGIKVVNEILDKKTGRGILVCGSGIGMSILANRFNGIRAALCNSPKQAEMSRLHNDSNILSLAADFMDKDTALECVSIWLKTDFLGGKYQARNEIIEKLSKNRNLK